MNSKAHAVYALPFFKYSPSGNITLLVPEAAVPVNARAVTARLLMRQDHVGAEQVGYIDSAASLPSLDMMGGEFCVNACRAMAALLHAEGRLTQTEPPQGFASPSQEQNWRYGLLRCSGVPRPLAVRARALTAADEGLAASREAGVCLSLPVLPGVEHVGEGIHLVRLPGISHLILDAAFHPVPSDWRAAAAALRRVFDLEHEEAVGCLWLKDNAEAHMTPVVWVRNTNETQLETACGSGSLACALYLLRGTGHIRIQQPGGDELEVAVFEQPSGIQAWISGRVECIARGEAFVNNV